MRFRSTALAETRTPLRLFKACQPTNCEIRTQPFTRRYCWPTQVKSTQQGITSLLRTTTLIRKKKKLSTKRKRKSPTHPQRRRQQFHRFPPNRARHQRRHHYCSRFAVLSAKLAQLQCARRASHRDTATVLSFAALSPLLRSPSSNARYPSHSCGH